MRTTTFRGAFRQNGVDELQCANVRPIKIDIFSSRASDHIHDVVEARTKNFKHNKIPEKI